MDNAEIRKLQLSTIFDIVKDENDVFILGDFNFHALMLSENDLISEHGFTDAWDVVNGNNSSVCNASHSYNHPTMFPEFIYLYSHYIFDTIYFLLVSIGHLFWIRHRYL